MLICPGHIPKGAQRRRWQILYQAAIWIIWKSCLTHWFDKPVKWWWPEVAKEAYHAYVKKQIHTDRILCMLERYKGSKYSTERFEEVWSEAPRKLKVRKGPMCLGRATASGEEVEWVDVEEFEEDEVDPWDTDGLGGGLTIGSLAVGL